MGTRLLNAGDNTDGLAAHPGGSRITPILTSWYKNQDKLQPDAPLGLYAHFALPYLILPYFTMFFPRKKHRAKLQ